MTRSLVESTVVAQAEIEALGVAGWVERCALSIVAGAGLIAYRFYRKPVTLTVAVGSLDGEARKVAALIAGRLTTTGAPVRLKVVNSGSVLDAAKAFAAEQVLLAVVREDVGDLSVHPGAAAFFLRHPAKLHGSLRNAIYLTPMVFGAPASIFDAAWRFLGVRARETALPALDALCVLPERIRSADDETELRQIEQDSRERPVGRRAFRKRTR